MSRQQSDSSAHSLSTTTTDGAARSPRDRVLTLRKDHVEITRSIKEVRNEDLVALGGALGLSHPKLLRMRDMPADMVAAWLRQEDDVIVTTGDPTWHTLANTLDDIGQGGCAKKIRLVHNIPQPKNIARKRAAPAGPDRLQVSVEETSTPTNRPPQPPSCMEEEEYIQLKTSLQDHNLHVTSKDKKVLLDEGIISVDSLLCLKAKDFSDVLNKLTVGGRGTLETFWTSKQTRVGVHERHDPVNKTKNEDEENIGQPMQETTQPNSFVNAKTDVSPLLQQSEQQKNAGKVTVPVEESELQACQPSASTVLNEKSMGTSEVDYDSENSSTDGDKASFKPYDRKLKPDGKVAYQPKLRLDSNYAIVTPCEAVSVTHPTGHDCYPMKSREHGLALIINNKKFARHGKREGTDRDEENLIETFCYLGYRVKVRRQCKKEKIEKMFDTMGRWIKPTDDSFVCCILSHGNKNVVYGVDSKDVSIRAEKDSIEMKLSKCKELREKPKMLFTSTCRGGEYGTGSTQQPDGESPPKGTPIPDRQDFAFFFSTLRNSRRNFLEGP